MAFSTRDSIETGGEPLCACSEWMLEKLASKRNVGRNEEMEFCWLFKIQRKFRSWRRWFCERDQGAVLRKRNAGKSGSAERSHSTALFESACVLDGSETRRWDRESDGRRGCNPAPSGRIQDQRKLALPMQSFDPAPEWQATGQEYRSDRQDL